MSLQVEPRIVEVRQNVLKHNDAVARALRLRFREAGVYVVSLVCFLASTLRLLQPEHRAAGRHGRVAELPPLAAHGGTRVMPSRLLMLLALCAGLCVAGTLRVYVANTDGASISVIDPMQNRVVGEIPVSKNPHAVILSPDQTRFYVPSESEDVLDVVDRVTSKTIAKVPLGRRPNNLAITPDGRRVYVCIRQQAWVTVIDTQSLKAVKNIPVGRGPHNVYALPDGTHMLATSMDDNRLTVINTVTEQPEYQIALPGAPRPVAMDAGPRHLFVQLSDLHGFVVVDLASRQVTRKILLPDAPAGARPLIPQTFSHGIAVEPHSHTLWVNSMLDNSVSVYALPGLQRLTTIPVGPGPDWLTFLPDGSRCYVSNAGADSVSVIDVATRKEITRIPVGRVPKRIIAVELR